MNEYIVQYAVGTAQCRHSITKTRQELLCGDVAAVCCHNRTKHLKPVEWMELLLREVVHIETTGLWWIKVFRYLKREVHKDGPVCQL